MKRILLIIAISLFIFSCTKKEDTPVIPKNTPKFEIGKNQFFTEVDGFTREYFVHVPIHYDKNTAVPVVFMLHGTSGDGEKFYNISGWKELGESENIITVYPSSGAYCVIKDGVTSNTTKWSVYPGSFTYCPGNNPMDDIKFLRQIVSELNQKFNINQKKVFLAGFSNGGEMAFRCAVEMGDIFAAIVESAGSYTTNDTTFTPIRKDMPITFQFGNKDEKVLGTGANFPLEKYDSLLVNLELAKRAVFAHSTTFGFESTYTKSGNTSTAIIGTFKSNPYVNDRVFNFILIKGLGHNYANGKNHPLIAAEVNWDWMNKYSLP